MNREKLNHRRPLRALRTGVVLLPLICALGVAPTVFASTPRSPVTVAVDRPSTDMPADRIAVSATLYNGHSEPVRVAFVPEQRDGLELTVSPPALYLAPGERASLRVMGSATAAGKQAVFLAGAVSDAEGLQLEETVLELHMRVARDAAGGLRATLSDYTTLFVNEGGEEVPGLGFVYPSQRGTPTGPQIPGDRTQEPVGMPDELPVTAPTSRSALTNHSLTVTGRFRWIDTKGGVRPAMGWRAVLYYWNGSKWIDSGAHQWVYSDASYSVTASVPVSASTRVTIYPSNRYFDLVNGKGQKYSFSLPAFKTSGSSYEYGAYYTDLNKGTAPGLGELHANAYDLWWKMENVAHFSPLRSQPIKVIFPGTNDCGSCSLNGTVHIEASHGTSLHTIRHELGHELMVQYWGYTPGNGGYHNWTKCYDEGLALSEGFAHFVSWWSTVNRTTLSGTWGTGWNGETMSTKVCQGVSTNELRIASAFWDLHDLSDDGEDDFGYSQPGHIFEAILGDTGPYTGFPSLLPPLEGYAGVFWQRVLPIAQYNYAAD